MCRGRQCLAGMRHARQANSLQAFSPGSNFGSNNFDEAQARCKGQRVEWAVVCRDSAKAFECQFKDGQVMPKWQTVFIRDTLSCNQQSTARWSLFTTSANRLAHQSIISVRLFCSFRAKWAKNALSGGAAPRHGNQCSINLVNLGNKCFHRHCWDCAIQCIFPTMKMARRAIMLLRPPAFAFRQLGDLLTRSLIFFYSKPLHSHLESAIDPPTSWQQISASVTFICKSHGDFSFLQKKKPFTGTCFKSFE